MIALVDADGIIFNCGFAVEHNNYIVYSYFDEIPQAIFTSKKDLTKYLRDTKDLAYETVKEVEPLENCLHRVKQKMESILRNTGATSYKVFIKGKGNFREEVAVTRPYKGNRDASHRPVYEQDIRKYLKEYWGAMEVDGQEVDDRVAQEQYDRNTYTAHDGSYVKWDINQSKSIIASPDKDLMQVPGWLYNYNTQEKFWVTEDEADKFFYTQLLTGDPSDNIQGVSGIGARGAEKLLQDCRGSKEMYKIARETYAKAYGEKAQEILTEMANLIYLRRIEGEVWRTPT